MSVLQTVTDLMNTGEDNLKINFGLEIPNDSEQLL